MRLSISALVLTLSLIAPAALAQSPGSGGPLPPELAPAFEALKQRDPAAHAHIMQLMQKNPDAAREELRRFAQYQGELEAARTSDPEKFALLQQQEQAEAGVRRLMQSINLATEEGRQPLIDQLRGELGSWFDLRQTLREREVAQFAAKLESTRAEKRARDQRQAEKEWITRITEGGAAAMRQRLDSLSGDDDLGGIAPVIVSLIMREDQQTGEALVALSQTNVPAFVERLKKEIAARAGLMERAIKQAPEEVRLHRALRTAAVAAHRHALPAVSENRALDPASDAELGRLLGAVIAAENAVVDANLKHVEKDLASKRAALAARKERKALLVEIQLARMTGRGEEYEW